MNLLRRTGVIILVVTLMFASVSVPAFAGDALTTEQKAEVLHDLDLFLGVDPDVFTPDLQSPTERAAAMVMLARAFGWVDCEDWDPDAVSEFSDVPEWAEPHVAYASEKEITFGVGGDIFGNDLPVTDRQLQTWFDRALGRGDTWDDNEELDSETALIRAELVSNTWDALMQIPVGQQTTLIEGIIGDDDEKLLMAQEAGLIDPDDYDGRIVSELSEDEDIIAVQDEVPFTILIPRHLPDGYTLSGVRVNTPPPMVTGGRYSVMLIFTDDNEGYLEIEQSNYELKLSDYTAVIELSNTTAEFDVWELADGRTMRALAFSSHEVGIIVSAAELSKSGIIKVAESLLKD